MKKLLSLPPNLVECFHEVERAARKEWFCTSDPIGHKLGSGGGTAWLLQACKASETDKEKHLRRGYRVRNASCCMPEGRAGVCRPTRLQGKY